MPDEHIAFPREVSRQEWLAARARDALNALRRRLPMIRITKALREPPALQ